MSQPKINTYVDSLQRQIADVAAKIKHKEKSRDNWADNDLLPYRYVYSDVEVKSYNLIGEEMISSTLGKSEAAESHYVTAAYGFVSNVDRPASVIEGLVFKNNQQFDFKV